MNEVLESFVLEIKFSETERVTLLESELRKVLLYPFWF